MSNKAVEELVRFIVKNGTTVAGKSISGLKGFAKNEAVQRWAKDNLGKATQKAVKRVLRMN